MFDRIHTSTDSNDTLFNPGNTNDADPASPHRFPTPARCWLRWECRPTRSAKFSPHRTDPARTPE